MPKLLMGSARGWVALTMFAAVFAATSALAVAGSTALDADAPTYNGGKPLQQDEEAEEELLQLDLAFTSSRTAGDTPITLGQAGELRGKAAKAAKKLRKEQIPSGPTTFGGAWTQIGPNPIVQGLRSPGAQRFGAMSGRIGALAIRPSNGQFILGAAQGGIWLYDSATGTWSSKTSDQTTQSIGALAIAPTNDAIVYAGTGEGALSGDSLLRRRRAQVDRRRQHLGERSRTTSTSTASRSSRIVVDPTNPDHVYVGGPARSRRRPPDEPARAHDSSASGSRRTAASSGSCIQEAPKDNLGATDLEIDPQNPKILYSSFWGDAIYKSTDGGKKWKPIMNGLPAADYAGGADALLDRDLASDRRGLRHALRRLRLGRRRRPPSEPRLQVDGRRRAAGRCCPAAPARTRSRTTAATQCFYDNVIEVDPTNPNIVFAAGQFNYDIGSGGIFRSDDGGADLDEPRLRPAPGLPRARLQPGEHRAGARSATTAASGTATDRGGRPTPRPAPSAVDVAEPERHRQPDDGCRPDAVEPGDHAVHVDRHGAADPAPDGSGAARRTTARCASRAARTRGSTSRAATAARCSSITDDPSATLPAGFAPACVVYGTYFGISPYRIHRRRGVLLQQLVHPQRDRPDRPVGLLHPVRAEPGATRTSSSSARTASTAPTTPRTANAGDVKWKTISDDLTTGCDGHGPERRAELHDLRDRRRRRPGRLHRLARRPRLASARTPRSATTRPGPRPTGSATCRTRPVAASRSTGATTGSRTPPSTASTTRRKDKPGHVFRTHDGGKKWTDVSGNLPDTPGQLDHPRPVVPEHALRRHRRRRVRDLQRRHRLVGARHGLPARRRSGSSTSTRPTALLAAGTHGRGAFDCSTRSARRRSSCRRSTPASPSGRRATSTTR